MRRQDCQLISQAAASIQELHQSIEGGAGGQQIGQRAQGSAGREEQVEQDGRGEEEDHDELDVHDPHHQAFGKACDKKSAQSRDKCGQEDQKQQRNELPGGKPHADEGGDGGGNGSAEEADGELLQGVPGLRQGQDLVDAEDPVLLLTDDIHGVEGAAHEHGRDHGDHDQKVLHHVTVRCGGQPCDLVPGHQAAVRVKPGEQVRRDRRSRHFIAGPDGPDAGAVGQDSDGLCGRLPDGRFQASQGVVCRDGTVLLEPCGGFRGQVILQDAEGGLRCGGQVQIRQEIQRQPHRDGQQKCQDAQLVAADGF